MSYENVVNSFHSEGMSPSSVETANGGGFPKERALSRKLQIDQLTIQTKALETEQYVLKDCLGSNLAGEDKFIAEGKNIFRNVRRYHSDPQKAQASKARCLLKAYRKNLEIEGLSPDLQETLTAIEKKRIEIRRKKQRLSKYRRELKALEPKRVEEEPKEVKIIPARGRQRWETRGLSWRTLVAAGCAVVLVTILATQTFANGSGGVRESFPTTGSTPTVTETPRLTVTPTLSPTLTPTETSTPTATSIITPTKMPTKVSTQLPTKVPAKVSTASPTAIVEKVETVPPPTAVDYSQVIVTKERLGGAGAMTPDNLLKAINNLRSLFGLNFLRQGDTKLCGLAKDILDKLIYGNRQRFSLGLAPTLTHEYFGQIWQDYLGNRSLAGENLYWGSPEPLDPRNVTMAWYNSPPHRKNLLKVEFTQVCYASGHGFVVQEFSSN